MIRTTAGHILINEALPEELRDYESVFDKSKIKKILAYVAKHMPDKYEQVAFELTKLGFDAASKTNGIGFTLDDLRTPPEVEKLLKEYREEFEKIYTSMPPGEKRDDKLLELSITYSDQIAKALVEYGEKTRNKLYLQVKSGVRGNLPQFKRLIGADIVYSDAKGNPIIYPVVHGVAKGLKPAEYLASSFGARKGVVESKLSISTTGDFYKQLIQSSFRLIVTDVDAPSKWRHPKGIVVSTSDPENIGAYLAIPAGGYDRNTPITEEVLADLARQGIKEIVVRSPISNGAPDGGVYAMDVGWRAGYKLPELGSYVGAEAAQAISEPLTQAQLNQKHSGGVISKNIEVLTGMDVLMKLVKVPIASIYYSVHAENDGEVTSIKQTEEGNTIIKIGDKEYTVPSHSKLAVNKGDYVEAGDPLTVGIPNLHVLVKYKGLGEARKQFVEFMKKVFTDIGMKAHRRNIEVVTAGFLSYVQFNDMWNQFIPGDIVPYYMVEHAWVPRKGSKDLDPEKAIGMYLEEPVLHYTIGTRVTKKIAELLKKYKINSIIVHSDPPPFESVVVRGVEHLGYDPDWMAKIYGGYGKQFLMEAVTRGARSDELGTSFIPALARTVQFGMVGKTKGTKFPEHIKMERKPPEKQKEYLPPSLPEGVKEELPPLYLDILTQF